MPKLQTICDFLQHFAPNRLAEDWDNVGLLVGDSARSIQRIMVCLTITPASAREAAEQKADLIVSHHPMPFRSMKRITTDHTPGRMLLELIQCGVAIYSPHTAFDSAADGINQNLAAGLGLDDIRPIVDRPDDPDGLGAGRIGRLPRPVTRPVTLSEFADRVKGFLSVGGLHVVGSDQTPVEVVAVACGSAGEFLEPARKAGCDTLVTGETTFHTCLEAEAREISLLLPGHYASERFAVESLATILDQQFSDLEVWASSTESDPLRWLG